MAPQPSIRRFPCDPHARGFGEGWARRPRAQKSSNCDDIPSAMVLPHAPAANEHIRVRPLLHGAALSRDRFGLRPTPRLRMSSRLAAAAGSVQNGTAADPRRRDDRLRPIRRLSRLTDLRTVLYTMITPLTLCLTRAQSVHEEPCAVCGAQFVPAEDSGSRQLSLMPADQEPFSVLMCGGCHSRWSHGVTVTIGRGGERSVVPVFRHPERG